MLNRPQIRWRAHRLVVTLTIGLLAVAGTALAPAAQASGRSFGTVTVVAHNLDNPRGLAFSPHGDLYIAEAGHGGAVCIGDSPEAGPQCAGLTSGLSKLSHGRVTRVVDHLISVASPDGSAAEGLVGVSTQGNRTYGQMALNSGVIPPQASGPVADAARAQLGRTLAIQQNGSWTRLASTGDVDYAWTSEHKALQPDQFPDANPNALATSGHNQYVADAGANIIAKVDNHGNVSTLAYLQVPDGSMTDSVPTCVAKAPDGSLYVGELLGGSFEPGHARVWRVADGHATVKWTGFTGIQGCGFDDAGNFYATEFQANGMFRSNPSGAVVRVAPNGGRTMLGVGSLFFPSGFAYSHGAIYVSNWSIMPAANGGGPTGEVVRISVG